MQSAFWEKLFTYLSTESQMIMWLVIWTPIHLITLSIIFYLGHEWLTCWSILYNSKSFHNSLTHLFGRQISPPTLLLLSILFLLSLCLFSTMESILLGALYFQVSSLFYKLHSRFYLHFYNFATKQALLRVFKVVYQNGTDPGGPSSLSC